MSSLKAQNGLEGLGNTSGTVSRDEGSEGGPGRQSEAGWGGVRSEGKHCWGWSLSRTLER